MKIKNQLLLILIVLSFANCNNATKKADFVILAENPLKIDPMKIKDIRIIETVFEGKSFPVK